MRMLAKGLIFALFISVFGAVAAPALAYSPVLSANYQGSGTNNLQITISSASPSASVSLSVRQSSSLWTVINNIGQTDAAGNFSQMINMPSDGSNSPIQIYATVGGQQTPTVSVNAYGNSAGYSYVCTQACGSGGSLSLSNGNLSLNVGQSAAVTVYNANYGGLYISANSSPAVASASLSGNQLNVYALATGNSTVTVCQSGSNNLCGSVYVNVVYYGGGNGCGYYGCGGGNLSLSQSIVSLNIGQTASVSAYSYAGGSLYLSSNSNPGAALVSFNGSSINIYGVSGGSSTVTVCSNNSNQCTSVYVTVGAGQVLGASTYGVWFGQSNVNLNLGDKFSVSIYSNNYGGGYYISGNQNWGIVAANITGNTLNLSAIAGGTATVTVCQAAGSGLCGSVYATVNPSYYSGGNYQGANSGCGYYGCGYNHNYNNSITLNQSSLSLTAGQSASVYVYGNGSYYLLSNSNSQIAAVALSGNVLNVYGGNPGSSVISVCQNNPTVCVNLNITVAASQVLGASIFANGQVVSDFGALYIVYKNTKTAFLNSQVFTDLGYSLNSAVQAQTSGLANSGYVISNASAQHPWGSWIKNGSAIYFVHESGLIPVTDWSTFLSNGGQANLLINANMYDSRLPLLSPLTANDYRLK